MTTYKHNSKNSSSSNNLNECTDGDKWEGLSSPFPPPKRKSRSRSPLRSDDWPLLLIHPQHQYANDVDTFNHVDPCVVRLHQPATVTPTPVRRKMFQKSSLQHQPSNTPSSTNTTAATAEYSLRKGAQRMTIIKNRSRSLETSWNRLASPPPTPPPPPPPLVTICLENEASQQLDLDNNHSFDETMLFFSAEHRRPHHQKQSHRHNDNNCQVNKTMMLGNCSRSRSLTSNSRNSSNGIQSLNCNYNNNTSNGLVDLDLYIQPNKKPMSQSVKSTILRTALPRQITPTLPSTTTITTTTTTTTTTSKYPLTAVVAAPIMSRNENSLTSTKQTPVTASPSPSLPHLNMTQTQPQLQSQSQRVPNPLLLLHEPLSSVVKIHHRSSHRNPCTPKQLVAGDEDVAWKRREDATVDNNEHQKRSQSARRLPEDSECILPLVEKKQQQDRRGSVGRRVHETAAEAARVNAYASTSASISSSSSRSLSSTTTTDTDTTTLTPVSSTTHDQIDPLALPSLLLTQNRSHNSSTSTNANHTSTTLLHRRSSLCASPTNSTMSSSCSTHTAASSSCRSRASRTHYIPQQLVELPGDAASHAARVKEVLSRPFGRDRLGIIARQYVVTINPAEWIEDQQMYKYRIRVHQPELKTEMAITSSRSLRTRQSLTSALIDRSLNDFVWLEQSLRAEYHGAALVPTLHAYLGSSTAFFPTTPLSHRNSHHPTPPERPLQEFLSDLMNGIRGQGEFYIPPDNILKSRSLEAFLYKKELLTNDGNHPNFNIPPTGHLPPSYRHYGKLIGSIPTNAQSNISMTTMPTPSSLMALDHDLKSPSTTYHPQKHQQLPMNQLFASYFIKPLENLCGGIEDVISNSTRAGFCFSSRADDCSCGDGESTLAPADIGDTWGWGIAGDTAQASAPLPNALPTTTTDAAFATTAIATAKPPLPLASSAVSQRFIAPSCTTVSTPPTSAIFSAPSPLFYSSSSNVIHCELLEAECALLSSHHELTLSLLDQITRLNEVEATASLNWRRLATSVITLFGYEKECEHFKLEKVMHQSGSHTASSSSSAAAAAALSKRKSPWRKIQRQQVETSLQSLASCYSSRYSSSSCETFKLMLIAFLSDLDSIPLAMSSYRSAMNDNMETNNISKNIKEHRTLTQGTRSKAGEKNNEDGKDDECDDGMKRQRLILHETWLRHSLTAFCRSLPIRTSRMAWRYWNTHASQCAALANAATAVSSHTSLQTKTATSIADAVHKLHKRHAQENREDDEKETELIARIINIHSQAKNEREGDSQRSKVLQMATERLGRWDSSLSVMILETAQIRNPNLDATLGRDLRRIRKYAAGLREHLNRCLECVNILQSLMPSIFALRQSMLTDMVKLFSGKPFRESSSISSSSGGGSGGGNPSPKRSEAPSMAILARAGVETTDPLGWSAALPNYDPCGSKKYQHPLYDHPPIGTLARSYLSARDAHTLGILAMMSQHFNDYFARVDVIEGFVYMECVGVQLEHHFSQQRSSALSAFEQKTDLTASLNVAMKKRLPKLKAELEEKLSELGDVSHTIVKEKKELHLASKAFKSDLHDLATRRLSRARETSTERVIQILAKWAKETETAAATELKALGEAMANLERAIGEESALFYPPKAR